MTNFFFWGRFGFVFVRNFEIGSQENHRDERDWWTNKKSRNKKKEQPAQESYYSCKLIIKRININNKYICEPYSLLHKILQRSYKLITVLAGWSLVNAELILSLILSLVLRIIGWQVEQFFPSQRIELAMDEERDRLPLVTDVESVKTHEMVLPQDAQDLLKAEILLL